MAGNVMKSTIAVSGENEYKRAIKACKDAVAEMKAELELVSAAYANDSKSIEANKSKLDALRNVQAAYVKQMGEEHNAIEKVNESISKHRERIAELREKIVQAQDKVEALKKSQEDHTEEIKKANDKIEAYNKTLSQHEKSLDTAQSKLTKLKTESTKTQTEFTKVTSEINNTRKAIQDAEKPTDDFAGSLKNVGDSADKSAIGIDLAQIASSTLGKMLTAGGVIKALKSLKDAFDAVINASREYESAFAGVLKTVSASQEELDALSRDILDLANEIPMTATEIAGIAEAAGQLGIQTENIIGFSETMAKLGVATDVTAESAATLLAQFAKVTDMDPSNYERLGSTIVDLGNNFATTESKIIDMAQRLAGAGATVGLSQADILGVAAALSSLGIEAEAGGSAVSKLLKKIETATKTYGKANEIIKETGLSVRELELLQDQDAKTYKALAEELNITTAELTEYREAVKGVTQFAEVSNMTAEEFIRAWGEDAVGALVSFTQGLGDTERTGQSAIEILNEMGITEVRMSDAVLRLANSGETLVEAQEMANKAWDENIALQVEAEKRFETTDSKVQLLSNSFQTFKILIGDQMKPAYDAVIGFLADMFNGINDVLGAEAEFEQVYISSTENMRTAAEEQVQHAHDVRDAMEEARSKMEEHRGEVETLITRIEELGSKDKLTAADEDNLREAIEKLNGIMPETVQYYLDLANGSKEAAAAVRELLKAEIDYNNYKTNKSTLEQGQESLKNLTQELADLTSQYDLLEAEKIKYVQIRDEIREKVGANSRKLEYDTEYNDALVKIAQLGDELNSLGAIIQKTQAAQKAQSLTNKQLLADISDYEEAQANAAEATKRKQEAEGAAAKETERMTDETVNAKEEANEKLSALDRIRLREEQEAAEKEAAAEEKAAAKAQQAAEKAAQKELAAEQKAAEKALKEQEKAYAAAQKAATKEAEADEKEAAAKEKREREELRKNLEERQKVQANLLKQFQKTEEEQRKAAEKQLKEDEKALQKYAASKGGYFPKDVAKSIKNNSSAVTNALQQMITEAGNATTSTAQKVGKQIADEITSSMQDALKLGNALSQSISEGKLTVGNNAVKGVGQYTLSELGLETDPEKYADWLEAMYAKGFDRSLSGAEIAKMLNMGIGVSSAIPGTGTGSSGQSDAWINKMNLLAQELGLDGNDTGNALTDAIKAQYEAQLTNRQLSYMASNDQNKINRERGWYEVGGQRYDYYTNEPIGKNSENWEPVNIVNNFNTEVETPATAAKKIQEAVEAALYQ